MEMPRSWLALHEIADGGIVRCALRRKRNDAGKLDITEEGASSRYANAPKELPKMAVEGLVSCLRSCPRIVGRFPFGPLLRAINMQLPRPHNKAGQLSLKSRCMN